MSEDVDYTFAVEDPPPPGSELARNMARAAATPNQWCRLVRYKNRKTADTTASSLRSGKRYPDRAPGTWEFQTAEREGFYGVWAKFTPPDPES